MTPKEPKEYDGKGYMIDTKKWKNWNNHNTIPRGWITLGEDHYKPVTFKQICSTKNVHGPYTIDTFGTIDIPECHWLVVIFACGNPTSCDCIVIVPLFGINQTSLAIIFCKMKKSE